jgi:hypothetical protein
MTKQHPITPPPIVREQWQLESPFKVVSLEREDYMIDRAAQWGADQELEACAQWVEANFWAAPYHNLHQFRRPKPPSLKEQALADLDSMSIEPCLINGIDATALVRAKYDNIRRALEALDD